MRCSAPTPRVSNLSAESMNSSPPVPREVGGVYVLAEVIGFGAFGACRLSSPRFGLTEHRAPGRVYRARNIASDQDVAVKLEDMNTLENQLETEDEVYKALRGKPGFPRVHWFGQDDNYNILVMDLLGSSLEELFIACGKRFSMNTVLRISLQAVSTVFRLTLHCILTSTED